MENNRINSFTDLRVWQEAHKLAIITYQETDSFPKHELFGLTSQLRRAAVSITSNIAEGFSRQSNKEKIQFYSIARGSLTEVENQLLLAKDIKYINVEKFEKIQFQLISVHRLLNAFIKSTRTF